MSDPLSSDGIWADHDWVSPADRRRGRITKIVLYVLLVLGGGLYIAGIEWIPSAAGLGLFSVGLVLILATGVLVFIANPYRRLSGDQTGLSTIFHISSALWEEGQTVTLDPRRCRKKQFITERWWRRRSRLVYFFPQRPTYRHAGGQILAGKGREPRYLYEMKLTSPLDRIYTRGPAAGTPSDVTVEVVRRWQMPPRHRTRSCRRRRPR